MGIHSTTHDPALTHQGIAPTRRHVLAHRAFVERLLALRRYSLDYPLIGSEELELIKFLQIRPTSDLPIDKVDPPASIYHVKDVSGVVKTGRRVNAYSVDYTPCSVARASHPINNFRITAYWSEPATWRDII